MIKVIDKGKLTKYLEDKIKECDNNMKIFREKNFNSNFIGIEITHLNDFKRIFQDILERLKSGKYE